jgi:hypothetical protein
LNKSGAGSDKCGVRRPGRYRHGHGYAPENPKDYMNSEALQRRWTLRSESCGPMAALIELKLSQNTPFQDRPGACKLIETAAGRGDQTMTQRLADCRAS